MHAGTVGHVLRVCDIIMCTYLCTNVQDFVGLSPEEDVQVRGGDAWPCALQQPRGCVCCAGALHHTLQHAQKAHNPGWRRIGYLSHDSSSAGAQRLVRPGSFARTNSGRRTLAPTYL